MAMPAVACGVYLLTRPEIKHAGFWSATVNGPYEWTAFALGMIFAVSSMIIVYLVAPRAERKEKALDRQV